MCELRWCKRVAGGADHCNQVIVETSSQDCFFILQKLLNEYVCSCVRQVCVCVCVCVYAHMYELPAVEGMR